MDAVDQILIQWRVEYPGLNTSAMGPIGRLSRVAAGFSRSMGETFAQHGLNGSSFDVLATLRRTPVPHALSAGDLMSSMMVTSGTTTNRIDQLERAGLVKRSTDPNDARRILVRLTKKGKTLVDKAIIDHSETQRQLLGGLSTQEVETLDNLLRKLMRDVEQR
ncbi:MAG: MarR family winged helix-turn-helix transcriptional regulator [Ruegeria sp.]